MPLNKGPVSKTRNMEKSPIKGSARSFYKNMTEGKSTKGTPREKLFSIGNPPKK